MKKLKLNILEMKNLSTSEMKLIMGGSDCWCACQQGGRDDNMNANYALNTNSEGVIDENFWSHKWDAINGGS
jgi:natural product precursor